MLHIVFLIGLLQVGILNWSLQNIMNDELAPRRESIREWNSRAISDNPGEIEASIFSNFIQGWLRERSPARIRITVIVVMSHLKRNQPFVRKSIPRDTFLREIVL